MQKHMDKTYTHRQMPPIDQRPNFMRRFIGCAPNYFMQMDLQFNHCPMWFHRTQFFFCIVKILLHSLKKFLFLAKRWGDGNEVWTKFDNSPNLESLSTSGDLERDLRSSPPCIFEPIRISAMHPYFLLMTKYNFQYKYTLCPFLNTYFRWTLWKQSTDLIFRKMIIITDISNWSIIEIIISVLLIIFIGLVFICYLLIPTFAFVWIRV